MQPRWITSSFSFSNGNCIQVTDWRPVSYSNGTNCVQAGTWQKSSRSGAHGQCVQVSSWQKSSHSGVNGQCIEIRAGRGIGVRDSKHPDSTVLTFPPAAWAQFTTALKNGSLT